MNQCHRILIVEDDPALRQMLTWSFEDLGYRVTGVDSLLDAQLALEEDSIPIALVDYRLPDGSGKEVLERLLAQIPGIRVLMYSGEFTEQRRSQALESGAMEFVAKPVSVSKICELLGVGELGAVA